jgi:O-succinylbenzoate synthase
MNPFSEIDSFKLENYTLKNRKGIYLHIEKNKKSAIGEVSPLPGRSIETLEMAVDQLEGVKKSLLDGYCDFFPLYPSVLFGLKTALYSLDHIPPPFSSEITSLFLEPPLVAPKGNVKLKLGNYGIEEAIKFYETFRRKEKNIRIDLERKWELSKTVTFCKKIDTSLLLYIEDPVKEYDDLTPFYEETKVAFALDMFLAFHSTEEIKLLKGLYSIIVKPSLVGGLEECRALQAAFFPIPISLSSLFETSIGINHIKILSSILCGNDPVGVDTLKFL